MGSLMAGWDSPVLDPKHVAYQRNRSFTKEEVEAYRRSKEEKAGEELRKAPSFGARETVFEERARKHERSNSLPAELEADTAWARLISNKGWWTRSNWAFLNEPPVFEGSTNSYSSQFHVANLHKSNA
ncbi:uncharacterized protein LOC115738676 isoform X1 [Rhodamnia argentea]|uniref:Uncharacterized protein LOC115738676 isoform X1 n=1 Tax=Rhodamnia argentea TaxID=178133 RepID=A0A8B8NZW9_9MYRT|nr:uncharacterized protein LOC115738676 isoform X1 [Rhodamnia argentea]